MNAASAVAEAEHLIATRDLTDRELGVAIARAVHPGKSLTELAAVCRMTKHAYAGVWRRLTSTGERP